MDPEKLNPFPPIIIIGCGGVGSYLLPTLLRTIRNHEDPSKSPIVHLCDGDKLELRNMERQLFDLGDVGKFKSAALVEKYKGYYPNLVAITAYFTGGEAIEPDTILIVCVDNHPGRMRALNACNTHNLRAILCGNGYTDAEAMYYHPAWQGTPVDPVKYYPEIASVEDGDPLRPEGCTGHAQMAAPQLAIANFMAAAYALHLLWFWTQEEHKIENDFKVYSPIRHMNNFSKLTTTTIRELRAAG